MDMTPNSQANTQYRRRRLDDLLPFKIKKTGLSVQDLSKAVCLSLSQVFVWKSLPAPISHK